MSAANNFQPTKVLVRPAMIKEAVSWVCNRLEFTIDRQSMNPRNLSERMDDGIMGEIASVAVMQFLIDKGRHVISYDQIRKDHYKEPDPGWDVLTARQSFGPWIDAAQDVKVKPTFAHSFSIKSSRIPKVDNDDIHTAIGRRDFKIFRNSEAIEMDITADFEVQVYYLLNKSQFDRSLSIAPEDLTDRKISEIITKLKLEERYGECYLSGAASRGKLVKYSESLPPDERYWNSFHDGYGKQMWKAPLVLGTSFESL